MSRDRATLSVFVPSVRQFSRHRSEPFRHMAPKLHRRRPLSWLHHLHAVDCRAALRRLNHACTMAAPAVNACRVGTRSRRLPLHCLPDWTAPPRRFTLPSPPLCANRRPSTPPSSAARAPDSPHSLKHSHSLSIHPSVSFAPRAPKASRHGQNRLHVKFVPQPQPFFNPLRH